MNEGAAGWSSATIILDEEERAQLFIQEMSSLAPPTAHQQRVTKHHLLPTRGSAGGYFCEKLRIQKLLSLKASLILEELTRRVSAQQPRNPITSA